MSENNHGTRRIALICAMTLLGARVWAGDGLTQNPWVREEPAAPNLRCVADGTERWCVPSGLTWSPRLDGAPIEFVCGPNNERCKVTAFVPSYPSTIRTAPSAALTGIYTTQTPPKPPECTVTLTLPPGDVPIPERVDAEVRHVGDGDRSLEVERCKIVVRSK